ncbi:MAG: hypothetical protein AVDCRST_MAG39-1598, partial [uncultured Sphingomonadaceae bacterium]
GGSQCVALRWRPTQPSGLCGPPFLHLGRCELVPLLRRGRAHSAAGRAGRVGAHAVDARHRRRAGTLVRLRLLGRGRDPSPAAVAARARRDHGHLPNPGGRAAVSVQDHARPQHRFPGLEFSNRARVRAHARYRHRARLGRARL